MVVDFNPQVYQSMNASPGVFCFRHVTPLKAYHTVHIIWYPFNFYGENQWKDIFYYLFISSVARAESFLGCSSLRHICKLLSTRAWGRDLGSKQLNESAKEKSIQTHAMLLQESVKIFFFRRLASIWQVKSVTTLSQSCISPCLQWN